MAANAQQLKMSLRNERGSGVYGSVPGSCSPPAPAKVDVLYWDSQAPVWWFFLSTLTAHTSYHIYVKIDFCTTEPFGDYMNGKWKEAFWK